MKITHSFLIYASDILGDTDQTLSTAKMIRYFNDKSVEYNVEIPHSKFPLDKKIPNKRTAFLQNLEKFSPEQQFIILEELVDHSWVDKNVKVQELKQRLYQQYGSLGNKSITKTALVQQTKHWLEKYPDAYKQYQSALKKYDDKVYERNLLDDLRLSLELLLRHVLKNSKSLENQVSDIGSHQKNKGSSVEVTNMFNKLLNYYSKYQNEYIKHNDKVKDEEIEFMIDLTSTFMKFLIK